jgi:hypothetical protein
MRATLHRFTERIQLKAYTRQLGFAAQSWADPRALSAEVPFPNLVPPHLHRQLPGRGP